MPDDGERREPNGRVLWVSTRGTHPVGGRGQPGEVRTMDSRLNPPAAGDYPAYSLADVWDLVDAPGGLPPPAPGREYRLLYTDASAVGRLPEHPRLKPLGFDLSDEHADRSLLPERGMWVGELAAIAGRAGEYGLLGIEDARWAQTLFRAAWPGVTHFTVWALYEIVPDAEGTVFGPRRPPLTTAPTKILRHIQCRCPLECAGSPMKVRPRLLALALPAVLVLLPWQTRADDKPKAKDTKAERDAVMVRKLGYAKDLLEGLSLQDYDQLTRGADGLIRCREEVTWRLDQTEDYLFYSKVFWRYVEEIKTAARKKNIDGATLAFLGMTQTCVKCHEHLRQISRRTDD